MLTKERLREIIMEEWKLLMNEWNAEAAGLPSSPDPSAIEPYMSWSDSNNITPPTKSPPF